MSTPLELTHCEMCLKVLTVLIASVTTRGTPGFKRLSKPDNTHSCLPLGVTLTKHIHNDTCQAQTSSFQCKRLLSMKVFSTFSSCIDYDISVFISALPLVLFLSICCWWTLPGRHQDVKMHRKMVQNPYENSVTFRSCFLNVNSYSKNKRKSNRWATAHSSRFTNL